MTALDHLNHATCVLADALDRLAIEMHTTPDHPDSDTLRIAMGELARISDEMWKLMPELEGPVDPPLLMSNPHTAAVQLTQLSQEMGLYEEPT